MKGNAKIKIKKTEKNIEMEAVVKGWELNNFAVCLS